MVSGLSIFFMFVSAAISIGLPVVLYLAWWKKYNLKFVPLIIGAVAFLLFKGLEQVMHLFVLSPPTGGALISVWANPALYIIYATLAAGVFEETGRFLAFHLLKKKYNGFGTGLSYGIGHGGIEAILLAGVALVSSIIMSLMINSGNFALLVNDPSLLTQLNLIADERPVMFLASGFERVIAISVHISLSIIVWCSVRVKGKLWMYPAAVLLHAIANIAPAMYQAHLVSNIWLIEFILVIPTALIAFAAYQVCKILRKADDDEAVLTEKSDMEAQITEDEKIEE